MSETTERVVEIRGNVDGQIVFRRSDGTLIWEGNFEGSGGSGEPPPKVLSQLLKYGYSSVNVPPPTPGQIRANDDDITAITEIWIHRLDGDNSDMKFLFMSLAKKDSEIYVQDYNDSTSSAMFKATQDPIDNGDYVSLNVEFEHRTGVPLQGSGLLLGVLI